MVEREYWEDGQLWRETPFYQGQKHGISKYWYNDGQPKSEYPYQQGQLHGILKWWYKDKQFHYKKYYLYNNEVTEEEHRRHELIEKLSGL